jgi:PD-(D/E)XK nuclease superfamily
VPDARSFSEVPFGGAEPKSDAGLPWDARGTVEIPDTGFRISGYIDRLDIAGDGRRAVVRDYKTGRPPKGTIVLDGGKELQRCLYSFAVKALLGNDVAITASLLFLREEIDLKLHDLRHARRNLGAGHCVPGRDTGGDHDDLAFALPANAANGWCARKSAAATDRLGDAARVWEAP